MEAGIANLELINSLAPKFPMASIQAHLNNNSNSRIVISPFDSVQQKRARTSGPELPLTGNNDDDEEVMV